LAKSVSSVKFTILDAQGKTVRVLSSSDKVPKIDVDHLEIPAYWVHPAAPISSSAGGHRLLWDFQLHDGGPIVPPGMYSVRMEAGGKSFTQPLKVVMDPRVKASSADMVAQYKMTLAVADEIEVAKKLRGKIEAMIKKSPSPVAKARLAAVLGGGGSGTPDEGGTTPMDFGSLRRVLDGLEGVKGAFQSAPAAPNAGCIEAFRALKAKVTELEKAVVGRK
jgi:hypothetical protein